MEKTESPHIQQPKTIMAQASLIASKLSTLLEVENDALARNRPRELAATEDEKSELSKAYQEHMDQLRQIGELVKLCPPEQMQELKAASESLNSALEHQQRLVEAARTVTDRMLRSISDEVNRLKKPVRAYDATANLTSKKGRVHGTALSAVAYHEVV